MSSFAPGKVILTGEHSVVAGQTAILASLNLGVKATIRVGVLNHHQQQDLYLQHLIALFAKAIDQKVPSFGLKVESSLQEKSGLGSSAAFAAAVLKELAHFCNHPLNLDQLYKLVLEAENFIHGKSSGADPSIVVYEGLIAFRRGIFTRISTAALNKRVFFLIDSGAAKESTGEMVAKVASQVRNQKILHQIGDLSQKMLIDLENGHFDPGLLNENQLFLEELGVVGNVARQIIRKLQQLGAFCKITGAGGVATGSGYILAFHEDAPTFEKELQNWGWPFLRTKLGII